jgi:transcriptional regulatory protein LevR
VLLCLQADALDNIWVPILVTTGENETEARATQLMKITAGTNTATQSAEIAKP